MELIKKLLQLLFTPATPFEVTILFLFLCVCDCFETKVCLPPALNFIILEIKDLEILYTHFIDGH